MHVIFDGIAFIFAVAPLVMEAALPGDVFAALTSDLTFSHAHTCPQMQISFALINKCNRLHDVSLLSWLLRSDVWLGLLLSDLCM